MPASAFVDKLHDQIRNEFSASQQYVAIAVHYDAQTLPRLAAFFYRQAVEERNHALMMVGYLIDAGCEIKMPGVDDPQNSFGDIVEPVQLALDQERRVSDQIAELAHIARDERDYISEQFVQWFLKEQVEEVASMSDLLRVVERAREDPMRVEDYLAREAVGDGGQPAVDPTAPEVAGGAL
jgi:bacterioferritin B